jgi:glycosyltransferase involved in cell wall biosynthesis
MAEKLLVSIIIPALNEEDYIGKCLTSINALDAPDGIFEVIVINNGSTDRTAKIAQDFGVQVYSIKTGPISRLRNYGVSKAKGKIFAFVDADCIVSKDWLKNALIELEDESVGATGSNYKISGRSTWVSKAWEFNMRELKNKCETDWIQSGNLIIKKDVFNLVGGFDEDLSVCEDSDICYRIKDNGYKIISSIDICSYHLGFAKNIWTFFNKGLWQGQDLIKVFFKHINKRRYLKVINFALFYLVCLLVLFVGILLLKIRIIIISFALMLTLPFILSISKSFEKREYKYILPLIALYTVFGLSKGISLIDFRNWRIKNNEK